MAKTESNMIPLGTQAPDFELEDVLTGERVSLSGSVHGVATVVMFICNHCPYVKHVNPELVRLAHDYRVKNVRFIAINSNDVVHYPQDSPAHMREVAHLQAYPFVYLYDESQEVAKAYQAACTPDFYVFDQNLSLVYRGQLDDSRPYNDIPLSGKSLREALDCLLEHRPIGSDQKPSLGCNIKWKSA